MPGNLVRSTIALTCERLVAVRALERSPERVARGTARLASAFHRRNDVDLVQVSTAVIVATADGDYIGRIALRVPIARAAHIVYVTLVQLQVGFLREAQSTLLALIRRC